MRWHIVSQEGNPKEKGFYFVIKKNYGHDEFLMTDRKWMGKKWSRYRSIDVYAWIGFDEIRKAGMEALLRKTIDGGKK